MVRLNELIHVKVLRKGPGTRYTQQIPETFLLPQNVLNSLRVRTTASISVSVPSIKKVLKKPAEQMSE